MYKHVFTHACVAPDASSGVAHQARNRNALNCRFGRMLTFAPREGADEVSALTRNSSARLSLQEFQRLSIELFDVLVNWCVRAVFEDQHLGFKNRAL